MPESDDPDEELPSIASDIPLSRTGSVYLLATMAASSTFFSAPPSLPPLHLLSEYAAILGSSLGDSATGSTGAEPEPLIDAVLFLGVLVLQNHNSQDLTSSEENDKVYNNILQGLSLLSANTPSPVLRYHAHLLTSSILHSHPSDDFKLAFIHDTLQRCPYENLKASAVGWLKDELLAADRKASANPKHSVPDTAVVPSIFGAPAVLSILEPVLFPNPETLMEGLSTVDAYVAFQANQAFFLAVLNLLYLLLSSSSLSVRLAAKDQPERYRGFLTSLEGLSRRFRSDILSGDIPYEVEAEKGAALAGLELLDVNIAQLPEI